MKYLICCLSLSLSSIGFCNDLNFFPKTFQETSSPNFTYYSLSAGPTLFGGCGGMYGAGISPSLGLGLGYRYQANHFGFDTNLQVSPLIALNLISYSITPLCYLGSVSDPWYIGVGGKPIFVFGSDLEDKGYFLMVPELKLGKQWKSSLDSKQFIQVELGLMSGNRKGLAQILFSYGKSF